MSKQNPPRWAIRLIKWYSHPDYVQEIMGDLEEMFTIWKQEKGTFRARVFYVWNAILFMRAYNSRLSNQSTKFNQLSMIKHSIKLSLRNIRKHKVYSLGNMLGLGIGISISLFIYIHITHELSFEKAYPKHERIFRVSSSKDWAQSPPSFAGELKNFFPEVEDVTRFAKYGGNASVIGTNEKQFISEAIFQADQSVVEVFDLKFIEGLKKGSLDKPYTVLITESIASKIFGDQNPVGEFVEINEEKRKFEVTGVIADLPEKSHLKAEALVSMPTFYEQIPEDWTGSRGWMVMYTYAQLDDQQSVVKFRERMPDFTVHYFNEEAAEEMALNDQFFEIMPLTDIHLKSKRTGEMGPNSSILYIYIFGTLAIFIIIIASVNFINIFTTLAFKRVKEIGLRKIVGAQRKQLIFQLLIEASVTAVLASALGLALCIAFLPYYNALVDLTITWTDLLAPAHVMLIAALAILLGLLSGMYPALLVTRQKLAELIVKNANPKASISLFRKGLIVFQFALSLFILISTVVVNRQMDFIKKKDLGFDADQVVTLKTHGNLGREIRKSHRSFVASLKQNPNIRGVSLASNVVGEPLSREYFRPADADPEIDYGATNMLWADEGYLDVMGIELVQGRNFRTKVDTSSVVFLVSEQIAKNWDRDAVGTIAQYRDEQGPIVGVFKNVNYYSLHSEVEPLAICLKPSWAGNLLFKIDGENAVETMEYIESRLKGKSPNAITQFSFVNDKLQQLYASENDMFLVFKAFSVLALIISGLGLLGIAAIEVQRRTKEVGIRKVLGASASEILLLLCKQFSLMLAIAILIGVPASYLSSKSWLADYSYRISLSAWEFALPSLGLIVISMLVVALHSIKVMRSNPTESLRSE
ncbi:MAG: FtsX-like permease family protein [Ekhidna sp.]